jgi:hypothetical protein
MYILYFQGRARPDSSVSFFVQRQSRSTSPERLLGNIESSYSPRRPLRKQTSKYNTSVTGTAAKKSNISEYPALVNNA